MAFFDSSNIMFKLSNANGKAKTACIRHMRAYQIMDVSLYQSHVFGIWDFGLLNA